MGALNETFNHKQLDFLEIKNRALKKAFSEAAKFAASSCERCPYDSKLGCNRTDKTIDCAKAVEQYFYSVKK